VEHVFVASVVARDGVKEQPQLLAARAAYEAVHLAVTGLEVY